jgi:hypothetical protein
MAFPPCFFTNLYRRNSFDLFAAAFYLITRYEEYEHFIPDNFQRYNHEASIAFRYHFLDRPIVDEWIHQLKIMMATRFNITIPSTSVELQLTYDIDIAYSYRGKGWWRNLGSGLRDLLRGQIEKLVFRYHVLRKEQKDPYDCYDELDAWHEEFQLEPIYFFLVSGGKHRLDKNLSLKSKEMQELIQRISSRYPTGIHPSFQSNTDHDALQREHEQLHQPSRSRQHYIYFRLPETFRILQSLGITDEYSMGYGSHNGFRAGTSHSFPWFDLEKNTVTDLRIHPFVFMECNSRFEQNQNWEQTWAEWKAYYDRMAMVGGRFTMIWHNFSLGTDRLWEGWSDGYRQMLAYHRKRFPVS